MQIKEYAQKAIDRLKAKGFEAYAVGGCIRNSLLSIDESDYDICTNALPEQTLSVFSDLRTYKTGIAHGTVTVMIDNKSIEITTYRSEGKYIGNRRPQYVRFVPSLYEDLSRRDFTMNALCYDGKGEIIDLFGGVKDILDKTIRAIGNPDERFTEDALRILRAVRFSAQLGFTIEKGTAGAMEDCKGLLLHISAERKLDELKKIICGQYAYKALTRYRSIIAQIIPDISACFDYNQNSKHHCYDVWEHTCRALSAIEADINLRLAMLFHDLGKPHVRTIGKDGLFHFRGHMIKSSQIARDTLTSLHCDTKTINYVVKLVLLHDERLAANDYEIKKFISKNSWSFFYDYMKIRYADTCAQSDYRRKEKLYNLDEISRHAESIRERGECVFLSELAVNGDDVLALGFKGKEIAIALDYALDLVLSGKCKNDKRLLISAIKEKL